MTETEKLRAQLKAEQAKVKTLQDEVARLTGIINRIAKELTEIKKTKAGVR